MPAPEPTATDRGLPGAVAVSRLRVYDWPAADGLVGGSPHLHTASAEGYVVIAGRGAVQTVSASGFAQTPLEPGVVLWFTPGTVHRLINDGGLEIVALMQNAGLPENGDAVLTFPSHVLANPERYREASAVPATGDERELETAARARLDLAVSGWHALLIDIERDRDAALRELYAASARIVTDRVDHWRELWSAGPLAQATETGRQLDALQAGRADHLLNSAVHHTDAEPGPERFGMCGRLTVWNVEKAR